jgi:hypothetical protein
MRSEIRQLFRPLRYIRIKHPAKSTFDWKAPLVLTVISVVALLLLGQKAVFVADGGLLAQIQELIQLLIGFFIAALAAIATFDEESLDQLMEGTPPTLDERDPFQGRPIETQLTRRRFLCFLFGYLAFLSIIIYLAVMVIRAFAPAMRDLKHVDLSWCLSSVCLNWTLWDYAEMVLLWPVTFLFWQMVTVTLLGLYYLTDRMHRDRPPTQT